ncbi:MAG: hypothetical protein A2X56_00270 [Nitrospirae bacterium GWC2_57_13]|nr:MAG: hypothetical protein A2X56_00270 [Nitrospirae bacterium GWC2_57_13]
MKAIHTPEGKIRGVLLAALISACLFVAAAAHAADRLSAITKTDVPTRLALDTKGNLYVTEPRDRNRLLIFDRQGELVRTLNGLKGPGGVVVDSQNLVYITSSATKSVNVYTADLVFSRKLGAGDNEFLTPNAVAVAPDGRVYVVDTKANQVKAYHANGASAFAFGGWGKTNGKFNVPVDLAVDGAAGEVYVTDMGIFTDPTNGDTAGARVQVFDLEGNFKRSFGQYGTGDGKIMRALGIAVAGGRVYIADGMQSVVHVFDTNGTPVETIYSLDNPMKNPIGLAVGKDGRLFIASSNTPSIEVYGLPGYTAMAVAPKSLAFSAIQGSVNPASQSVTITNSGTGTLSWTVAASPGANWIAPFLQVIGETGPGSATPFSIAVNSAGLAAGSYNGSVTFTAASGVSETVAITLLVAPPPPLLTVGPASLSFTVKKNGTASEQSLSIQNSRGGAMTWTAASSSPWITLTPASGSAPGTVMVGVNSQGLAGGAYTGSITVTAPGAEASPTAVSVALQVLNSGKVKVTSNLSDAKFALTGPAVYNGGGTEWVSDTIEPGSYTIAFEDLAGYAKVASQTFTLAAGGEVALHGEYVKQTGKARIIAGSAGENKKNVTVLALDGVVENFFEPFGSSENIRVAAADLDNDGLDEIIVTDGKRNVKVMSAAGTELASYELPAGTKHAVIASGDVDADGKVDLLVGYEAKGSRTVLQLAYSGSALTDGRTLVSEDGKDAFTLAAADLNADGAAEVVIADEGGLRAYKVSGASTSKMWALSGDFGEAPEIAAGDLDGDGTPEIAMSRTLVTKSVQQVRTEGKAKRFLGIRYKKGGSGPVEKEIEKYSRLIEIIGSDGRPAGVLVQAEGHDKNPSSIALGDLDSDGKAEIIAAAGSGGKHDATINIYTGAGALSGSFIVPDSTQGLNVGLGMLK